MTAIQWTDETWNPTRGCSVVSPGCVNCYAMKQAHRFSGEGKAYHGLTKQTKAGPQWTGTVVLDEPTLLKPVSWKKPRRVFVNSMSDLFHEAVSDADIDRVFAVMALCPQHTFQVLTKRPARMQRYLAGKGREQEIWYQRPTPNGQTMDCMVMMTLPLPNVWLGVSVETQQYADERIPLLLHTPAAVHFISAEPLLGPVKLDPWLPWNFDTYPDVGPRLDWVIVGGESGPGARPFDLAWARSIVQQCKAAGIACFVKQLGARAAAFDAAHQWFDGKDFHQGGKALLKLRDRKGGNPDEWPADLRVREWPQSGDAVDPHATDSGKLATRDA